MQGRTIKAIISVFVIATLLAGVGIVLNENVKDVRAQPTGNVLYVGGSGANNYTKIQDAVDNASDGDTIFVYSGIYYENVVVNKRINLIGEDRNKTTIDGIGSGDVVVYVTADYVSIIDFKIENIGSDGIELYNVQYCHVDNNTASSDYSGISLSASSNCTISNCTISNSGSGIYLSSSNSNTIANNTISDNGDGIYLKFFGSNIITGNNVSNNKDGIYLSASPSNTIANNTISNNRLGIYLYYSRSNTIANNTISDNRDEGIQLSSSNSNTIANNTISDNRDEGIQLSSSNSNTIANNTISDNRDGISLSSSNSNTIANNTISNKDFSIFLESSIGTTITGNTMVGSSILIYEWEESLAYWNTHNIDTSNTVNGKPVYYYKNATGITVPLGAGQVILANCTNVMVENQYVSNGTMGIELGFSSGCTINNNTIINGIDGIHLFYSSNNFITNNTVCNNSWDGIRFDYSNNNTVINNTVSNNRDGIFVHSSAGCTIQYNNIYMNEFGIFNNNFYESEYMANATQNWWGSADGPSGVGPGSGDYVSENVIYIPWLTEPYGILVNPVHNLDKDIFYVSIQAAIDDANPGDTIFVSAGTYYETVVINKSINLHGEDRDTTIIDGNGSGDVVNITANWVSISGFTMRNSGIDEGEINSCLSLYGSSYSNISYCTIVNNLCGIHLSSTNNDIIYHCKISNNAVGVIMLTSNNNSSIIDNIITNNTFIGVELYKYNENNIVSDNLISNSHDGMHILLSDKNTINKNNISKNIRGIYMEECNDNTISENTINSNSDYGVQLWYLCNNNIFYNNNFINNTQQAYDDSNNSWNHLNIGNYWSDFDEPSEGAGDNNSDGIVDSPYYIPGGSNQDLYPLMNPWGSSPVTNLNTSEVFLTIQDAIDDSDTLAGHIIFVKNGIYYGHITVNKAINLIGEDRNGTIIDGGGSGIVVNITADWVNISGFTIQNGDYWDGLGIKVSSRKNTINNNIITTCYYGIKLNSENDFAGEDNIICNNSIHNNSWGGIYLYNSKNNTIQYNKVRDNFGVGLCLYNNSFSIVKGNFIGHNGDCDMWLEQSGGNILRDNFLGQSGLAVLDLNLSGYFNDVDASNTVDGKPIYYIINGNNMTISSDAGEIIFVNCKNCAVQNLSLAAGIGVEVINSSYTSISNNLFSNTGFGIFVMFSDSTFIKKNIVDVDGEIGVFLYSSDNNTIYQNIVNNSQGGISLMNSSNNSISNCNISNNDYCGIRLDSSSNNTIYNCNISNNDEGINLDSSPNNEIHYNNIYGNSEYGIRNWNSELQYMVNAAYNYWGSPSGPYHPTLNPSGIGDNVSDNVDFIPWLTAPVKGAKEESIEEGQNEIDATDEADMSLEINATANNSVRIISYEEAPVEEPEVVKSIGKYIEIEVENETAVEWPIFIQIYYTQEDLNNAGITEDQIIGIYFYNESSGEWELYNNTGVNTTDIMVSGKQYAGYAWTNAWHLTNLTIGADSTKPEIRDIKANPENQEIYGHVNISCIVTDNIETSFVYVNITYTDSSVHNFSMTNIAGTDAHYYNASYSLQGNYEYFVWANDTSGNANTSSTKTFSIFVPQYTLTTYVEPSGYGYITLNPSGGTYDEGIIVTLTANPASGYEFDHWSGDASGSNPTIQITMNSNKSITAQFLETTSPNHPPTVELTSPANGSMMSGTVSIAGAASDTDGTVQSVQVKIDSGLWINATGTTSWNYSWDTTAVANGSHTIYARSYDGTNYSNISSLTVNVNNIPPNHKPTVEIIFPNDGMDVKKTFTIHGTASDEDGDEIQVEIKIGDGSWKVVNGTTTWNYTWDSTSVDNGEYSIQVRSYDGHEYSSIDSIMVKVNNKKEGGGTPGFEFIALLVALTSVLIWGRKRNGNKF